MKTLLIVTAFVILATPTFATTTCTNYRYGDGLDVERTCINDDTQETVQHCMTHQFWVSDERQIGRGNVEDYQTTCD